MSVSKNWDTNLRLSEKKTLRGFLGLYLFLCIAIFLLLGFGYYQTKEESMLKSKRYELNNLANIHIKKLKQLHINIAKTKKYPRDERYVSGIYDSSKKKIFSLLFMKPNLNQVIYQKNGYIHYIRELESFYLGAKYLVLEVKDDGKWLKKAYMKLAWVGIPVAILFLVVGYFLHRLLLRPMKEALSLLDRFIKDTTHELNTPISAILSNIEIIDTDNIDQKNQKRLKRIAIGARTVSNLYQDLVFLTLGHMQAENNEDIDLMALFNERVEYFAILIENKQLTLTKNLSQSTLHVDKQKITKLIDNLLSNAIKYNRIKGTIDITLCEKSFQIKDNGYGMDKDEIETIFERYSRGKNKVGGFGIGLNLVSKIASRYGLKIEVISQKGTGTCIKIIWD